MNAVTPVRALWFSVFVTASYPVAGKLAAGYVSPSIMVLSGAFIAVLCFAPWLTKNKLWGEYFKKETFLPFCFMGLFGTALPFLGMLIALLYTTPANAAILNQTEIIYSLIISAVFLKERPTALQLFGTLLIISGVICIISGDGFSVRWKGDLIVAGVVWMFQVSHAFAKKLPAHLKPAQLSAGRAMSAFVWSVPIALILNAFSFDVKTFVFGWRALAVIFYLGVINYSLSNALWYKAIRNMHLSKATAVMMSYPVFTYLISVLCGTDKLTAGKTTGLILALCGAYLVTNIIRGKQNETGSL
jgi:drug/metabolite transporter (DMT)-like permease